MNALNMTVGHDYRIIGLGGSAPTRLALQAFGLSRGRPIHKALESAVAPIYLVDDSLVALSREQASLIEVEVL